MKRILCLLLTIMLLLPNLTGTAGAVISGDCGDDLVWSFDDATGTLRISGTGGMFDFAWEDAPWCIGGMDVKQIVLEEGVTAIGSYAFRGCTGLTSVSIPATVTEIREAAFSECEALTAVHITDLAAWMNIAFSVWVEEEYNSDGGYWQEFEVCSNPLSVSSQVRLYVNGTASGVLSLPEGIGSVGDRAFWGYENITGVIVPDGTVSIGANAFENCTALKTVTLPVTVKTFGDNAFNGCEALTDVYYAGKPTQLAGMSFGTGNRKLINASWHCGETHTHVYSAWEQTEAPGCTLPGEEVRFCEGCDHYERREIAALGHDVENGVCTRCDSVFVRILTQPASVAVAKGKTAKVTVEADGEGLSYAWYFKNANAKSFALTTSFTSNSYSVTMNESRSGRQIYCVVTDRYGNSVRTDTVTLEMEMNVAQIVTQPKSVWVYKGEKAVVTLDAVGDGLTYKWYYKNPGASKYTYTSTFKGSSYSVVMSAARSGRYVYCKVTDAYGNTVKSKTVSVNMKPKTALEIVTQPKSVWVAEGETATVTVGAKGDGLTYKWYFKNPGASKYTYTSTFKGNSYSVAMNEARDGRYVYCKVTDIYGNTVKTKTVSVNMK